MPRVTNMAAAMGLGTAWGGHLSCKEEISRVQFPEVPFDVIRRDPLAGRFLVTYADANERSSFSNASAPNRHGATGSADPLQG